MDNSQLQKWALVAEIIGGIAIVLSIVYLAIEVQGNTNAIQSQTNQGLLEVGIQINSDFVEYAELEVKASNNWEGLSEVERYQYRTLRFSTFNTWEHAFNANRNGTLTDELYLGYIGTYGPVTCRQSVGQIWKEIGSFFGPEFRSHVDEVSSIECAQSGF